MRGAQRLNFRPFLSRMPNRCPLWSRKFRAKYGTSGVEKYDSKFDVVVLAWMQGTPP